MQPNKTALLVMDMQAAMIRQLPHATTLLAHTAKAIAHARSRHIPVVYVVVGFRQGAPEISMNNKGFAAFKDRLGQADMGEWMKIDADVAPEPGEIVVTKRRVSAYAGSDLAVVLSALEARHLVLTGYSTSGVVLSTLVESADRDFGLTVLSDCCADPDEELHHVLLTKYFNKRADVVTVDDWTKL
jgi:nicotinamidase-related amidase